MKRPGLATGLLLLTVLLGACEGPYRVVLKMPSQNLARVELLGDQISVLVSNKGPGYVDVNFEMGGVRSAATRQKPGTDSLRPLPGPVIVGLRTGDTDTEVVLSAERATGLRVLSAPRPRN